MMTKVRCLLLVWTLALLTQTASSQHREAPPAASPGSQPATTHPAHARIYKAVFADTAPAGHYHLPVFGADVSRPSRLTTLNDLAGVHPRQGFKWATIPGMTLPGGPPKPTVSVGDEPHQDVVAVSPVLNREVLDTHAGHVFEGAFGTSIW
jgi:hypothetical protein